VGWRSESLQTLPTHTALFRKRSLASKVQWRIPRGFTHPAFALARMTQQNGQKVRSGLGELYSGSVIAVGTDAVCERLAWAVVAP
jgi:hypothetical protein